MLSVFCSLMMHLITVTGSDIPVDGGYLSRPVARLFKRGVHMCMGLITIMYLQQGLEYFLLAFMHVLVTTAYCLRCDVN